MTLIRTIVLSLAFLVPASFTAAHASEAASETAGDDKPKKAKKTKKSSKPKKDKDTEGKSPS